MPPDDPGGAAGAPAPDVTAIPGPARAATDVFVLLPTLHDLWAVRELSAWLEAAVHALVPAWSPQRPYDSVPALGSAVAGVVRRIQPRGPYRLVGSCAAGQTAMEAAARLAGDGQPIALLALLDTPAPRRAASLRPLHQLLPVPRRRWAEIGQLIVKLARPTA